MPAEIPAIGSRTSREVADGVKAPRITPMSNALSTDSGGVPGTQPGHTIGMRAIRARHARLHETLLGVADLFWRDGMLTPRDRELITIRVGVLANSPYELYHHRRIGLASGLTTDEIAALDVIDLSTWGDRDRAILEGVDELVACVDISDSTWSSLAFYFSDPELIEIVYLVGWYWSTCAFVNVVRVPVDNLDAEKVSID